MIIINGHAANAQSHVIVAIYMKINVLHVKLDLSWLIIIVLHNDKLIAIIHVAFVMELQCMIAPLAFILLFFKRIMRTKSFAQ